MTSPLPTPSAEKTDRRFAAVQDREKTGWEVSDIWDVHHQIKRRIFLGQKNVEIARSLGCTKEQVSSVRNSPVIQEQLREMQKLADAETVDIKAEVKELAPKALRVMEDILDNETVAPNVKLAAAKDVLDRGGHSAPQQVQHLHGHFTAEDLDQIKNRAKQIGSACGTIADDETPTTATTTQETIADADIIDI